MPANGSEPVTLEQFKRAVSGGGGKKYKITKSRFMPEYVKAEASPGEVVVTSVLGDNNLYPFYVYEDAGDGSTGKTVEEGRTSRSIDDLPEVVKQAVEEIPQTNADIPPVADDGYGWFIMPPCDVVLQVWG